MVSQANIPIHYDKKFVCLLSETNTDITWVLDNGATTAATCLVGADSIHTKVRKYLYPELKPKFTNAMAPQQHDGSELLIGR